MLGFIVRSRNEEQYIGFALQSIFDKFGNDTKVIVVDNESTDDTLKIVQNFPKKFFNIDVISIGRNDYTPGKALNLGLTELQNSNCNFAGILSSHCEITSCDLNSILHHFDDSSCFAIMGKQIPIKMGKRVNPRYIWSNFLHENVVKNIKEQTLLQEDRYFFHNAFSFLRINQWSQLKFDESLSGKEDRYWAKDQINLGKYFIFDPKLQCKHYWTAKGATWSD